MRTVLCDINFVLDIFLRRDPFYTPASRLFSMIEEKRIRGYLCALSFPTLFYILAKELESAKAMQILEKLRIVFDVAAIDEKVIDLSLVSGFKDFEYAVQYYSAIQVRADRVITRNRSDFRADTVAILTPEEFLASTQQRDQRRSSS